MENKDMYATSLPETSNVEEMPEENEFKRKFKLYKRRNQELDLSSVIDHSRICDDATYCIQHSFMRSCKSRLLAVADAIVTKFPKLRPSREWTIATFRNRPGLFIIGGVFSISDQLHWLRRCLLDFPDSPNVTNLSPLPGYQGRNVFRTYGEKKLRWVTMGNHYDWNSKQYAPDASNPLPREMANLAKFIVETVLDLGSFCPDAAIINYYPEKAYLSPHIDRSERDLSRPLISVSFGQTAIYLTGGLSLDDPVDALFLHSGDILVMSGEQRLVYHSVPRIVCNFRFDTENMEVEKEVLDYANRCRVNITVRQVSSPV